MNLGFVWKKTWMDLEMFILIHWFGKNQIIYIYAGSMWMSTTGLSYEYEVIYCMYIVLEVSSEILLIMKGRKS